MASIPPLIDLYNQDPFELNMTDQQAGQLASQFGIFPQIMNPNGAQANATQTSYSSGSGILDALSNLGVATYPFASGAATNKASDALTGQLTSFLFTSRVAYAIIGLVLIAGGVIMLKQTQVILERGAAVAAAV